MYLQASLDLIFDPTKLVLFILSETAPGWATNHRPHGELVLILRSGKNVFQNINAATIAILITFVMKVI